MIDLNKYKTEIYLLILGMLMIIYTLGYYTRHPELNNFSIDEERTTGSGIYEW